MKKEKYTKKTFVICPICGEGFIGASSKNKKGCPKYECSVEWDRIEHEMERIYARNYKLKWGGEKK